MTNWYKKYIYAQEEEIIPERQIEGTVTSANELPPQIPNTVRIYHYTSSDNIDSIKRHGIIPGSKSQQGEKLGHVMASISEPTGRNDNLIYFVADIPSEYISQKGGFGWVEINNGVSPSDIVGIIHRPYYTDSDIIKKYNLER